MKYSGHGNDKEIEWIINFIILIANGLKEIGKLF